MNSVKDPLTILRSYTSMAEEALGQQGVLNVVPPAALEAMIRKKELERAAVMAPVEPPAPELNGYIRGQFEIMRNHRNTAAGWSNRLLEALRTFNGQYSPDQDAGGVRSSAGRRSMPG